MARGSGIQWTDHTWNPWHGCVKVSPGCKFCYMYRDKNRYGQDPTTVVRSKTTFSDPLKWDAPARVFTCSWSDFFIEQADPWRNEAWDIIRRTPHLTYQILTKRPERIIPHLPMDCPVDGYPNVWLGISAESQEYLLKRWRWMPEMPAAKLFLSLEPLLGPIRLADIDDGNYRIPDWVIVGGETGKADEVRPTDNNWIRKIRDDCGSAGIPLFVKQITSSGYPIPFDRWPEDLKIREFPNG